MARSADRTAAVARQTVEALEALCAMSVAPRRQIDPRAGPHRACLPLQHASNCNKVRESNSRPISIRRPLGRATARPLWPASAPRRPGRNRFTEAFRPPPGSAAEGRASSGWRALPSGRRIEIGASFDSRHFGGSCWACWSGRHARWGPATRIYLAAGATDMRKGFEGLYGLARDRLLWDPLSGHVFLFANAQRNRLKLLFWEWQRAVGLRQASGEGRFAGRSLRAGRPGGTQPRGAGAGC